jgi:hypothetical protein
MPGARGTTPPPSIPLGFLALSGLGLWAFGVAGGLAADRLVSTPSHPGALAAVHVGMLAFLTTAVLGAIHQFAPVVGRRPLRSIPAARFTLVGMAITGWLIPSGFAHGPEALVATGGVIGALTVALAAWNLSGPLSARDGGVPLNGLRLSDRLSDGHRRLRCGLRLQPPDRMVPATAQPGAGSRPPRPAGLARAHLRGRGREALADVPAGPPTPGPSWGLGRGPARRWHPDAGHRPPLRRTHPGMAGRTGSCVAGIGFHLTSLYTAVRHRRRALELLHGYLFTSAAFAVIGVGLAATAAVADVDYTTRSTLVVAEVTALAAWLSLAVIGHAHKIVPFIGYTVLRSRGIATGPTGRPLMFGDLFHHRTAQVSLIAATAGFDAVMVGVLIRSAAVVSVGGLLISLTGLIVTANLVHGPRRAIRAHRSAVTVPEVHPMVATRPAS